MSDDIFVVQPDVAFPIQPPELHNCPIRKASLSLMHSLVHDEIEFFCKKVQSWIGHHYHYIIPSTMTIFFPFFLKFSNQNVCQTFVALIVFNVLLHSTECLIWWVQGCYREYGSEALHQLGCQTSYTVSPGALAQIQDKYIWFSCKWLVPSNKWCGPCGLSTSS